MLIKQTLAKSSVWHEAISVAPIEAGQPEGTRMELAFHFGFRSGVSSERRKQAEEIIQGLVAQADRALAYVDHWPEEAHVVTWQDGVLRTRWMKNPVWLEVIWAIIRPLVISILAAAVVVAVIYFLFWALSKYKPAPVAQALLLLLGMGAIWYATALMRKPPRRTKKKGEEEEETIPIIGLA